MFRLRLFLAPSAHLLCSPSYKSYEPPLHSVESEEQATFPWPPETKALVLYAFYIGYAVLQVPGGWMADKFGARYVLLICVAVTTVSTALFPIVTSAVGEHHGHIAAVVLRFILGAAHGPCIPAVSSMVSTWLIKEERAMWGGVAYAGTNLGAVLGNSMTGILIDNLGGWPGAFYFWAAYSGFFFFLVLLLLYSFPDSHPFISQEEADFIRLNNSGNRSVTKRALKTPWKAILLNVPYWANITGQFGHNYIYFILITYLPTYMREILQFEVSSNGLFSAAPFLALWITSLVLSFTTKYFLKCMSQKNFDMIMGTGSNMACAAFMLGAVYVGCNKELCITLYIMGMVVKAFYYVTLPVNINNLTRNYGGTCFGLVNAVGSLSGIIGNFIVGHITKHKAIHEWQLAFWITFGVAVGTSIIFILFSADERQEFDYDEDEVREL